MHPHPTPPDTALQTGLAQTVQEIARTDTKAGLLLTLDGLLLAALSLFKEGGEVSGVSLVLAAIGATALVLSVILALLVVRPRLHRHGGPDKNSFVHWAIASDADIEAGLREDRRLPQLRVLSQIVLRKMRRLRLAGDASLIAVITIAAAILTR